MREHLHARLELERLAAFCNLSKFHFVSRYKAITGRTPIQHFLHLKIEYACQLLDSSDQSVARVGQAVGYDDSLLLAPVQQGHGFVAERLPAAGKAGRGGA